MKKWKILTSNNWLLWKRFGRKRKNPNLNKNKTHFKFDPKIMALRPLDPAVLKIKKTNKLKRNSFS